MKKRKAKRTKSAIDIDLEIGMAVSNSEKLKTEALLNLIAKIIFDKILRQLDSKDEPLE